MSMPHRHSPSPIPKSNQKPGDPIARLVRRVNSLETWTRTLITQHEQWLDDVRTLAERLEATAEQLDRFSQDFSGLDARPDIDPFDEDIPF